MSNQQAEEHCVEERKDSKRAASVEVSDLVLCVSGVVKNSCYQKTREYEEEINSHPAGPGHKAPQAQ